MVVVLIFSKNAARSIEFYWEVFGVPPTYKGNGEVGFSVPELDLAISVKQMPEQASASKPHMTLKLTSDSFVQSALGRLEADGLMVTDDQEIGCRVKDDVLVIRDPEGNHWEIARAVVPA